MLLKIRMLEVKSLNSKTEQFRKRCDNSRNSFFPAWSCEDVGLNFILSIAIKRQFGSNCSCHPNTLKSVSLFLFMMHLMSLSELLTRWSCFTALSSAGVAIRGRFDLASSPGLRAPTQPSSPFIPLLIGRGGGNGGWVLVYGGRAGSEVNKMQPLTIPRAQSAVEAVNLRFYWLKV